MAYVTINATQLKNCTLLIKDGYNREVAYTYLLPMMVMCSISL